MDLYSQWQINGSNTHLFIRVMVAGRAKGSYPSRYILIHMNINRCIKVMLDRRQTVKDYLKSRV